MLKFITGNKQKFKEVQELIRPIEIRQLNISLDEIQDIDPHKIIRHKLNEAFKHHKGPFIIEDDSVNLDCFGGRLPGPFIKFFWQEITIRGLYNIVKNLKDDRAEAFALIAYAKNPRRIKFFEGTLKGKIVSPKGSHKFGYDEIFLPDASSKTFSEMKAKGDFTKSPRGIAVKKFKEYLLKQQNAKFTKPK